MKISKIKKIKFSLIFRQSQPLSDKLAKMILKAINKCHTGKENVKISESVTDIHKEAHHRVLSSHEASIDFIVDEYGKFHPTSLKYLGESYKLEKIT